MNSTLAMRFPTFRIRWNTNTVEIKSCQNQR